MADQIKLNNAIDKLTKLTNDISDRHNTTPDILSSLSKFVKSDLTEIVTDLEELRDELEEEGSNG